MQEYCVVQTSLEYKRSDEDTVEIKLETTRELRMNN